MLTRCLGLAALFAGCEPPGEPVHEAHWRRAALADTGAPAPAANTFLGGPAILFASDGEPSDYFGYSVSSAGDVNGDGFEDVIVGALGDNDLGDNAGSSYVYLGGVGGIDPASEVKLLASDGGMWDEFGRSVSGAGDIRSSPPTGPLARGSDGP